MVGTINAEKGTNAGALLGEWKIKQPTAESGRRVHVQGDLSVQPSNHEHEEK